MDDEVPMGEFDGVADLEEEAKAGGEGEFVGVGELVEGEAVDVFHDEVGDAGIFDDAAVEEFGDVGMAEMSKDLAFGAEAFEEVRSGEMGGDEFEGGGLFEVANDAFDEEHGAHAAAAEEADGFPGAIAAAGEVEFGGEGGDGRGLAFGVGGLEQGAGFREEGGVVFTLKTQPRFAIAFGEGEGGIEEFDETSPTVAGHGLI